jgi:hypothetical protein
LGTIDKHVVRMEVIIGLAGSFCGGLAVGVLARILIPVAYPPLASGAIFAAFCGCAEFVKLGIRRRTAGEALVLAAADAVGVFAGFGLSQLLFLLAP